MHRITQKHLEAKVERLNRIFNKTGRYSEIGAFCLDYAYGGVTLHQYANEHGGVRNIFNRGYMPKRELCELICAYEIGLDEHIEEISN